MWDVEYTDEFEEWWLGLTQEQQEALDDRVMLLARSDPASSDQWSATSRRPAIPT